MTNGTQINVTTFGINAAEAAFTGTVVKVSPKSILVAHPSGETVRLVRASNGQYLNTARGWLVG